MKKLSSVFLSVLNDIILISAGVIGVCLALESSYLNYSYEVWLFPLIILLAAAFSIIYRLKGRYMIAPFLGVTVLFFGVINPTQIGNGLAIFMNSFTQKIIPHFNKTPIRALPDIDKSLFKLADTSFLAFLAFILIILIGFCLIKLQRPLPAATFSLPFFALSLFFINFEPAVFSVILYLAFIIGLTLTSFFKKRETISGNFIKFTSFVLAIVFMLSVQAVIGENKRFEWEDKIFQTIEKIFPLRTKISGPDIYTKDPPAYMSFFDKTNLKLDNMTPAFNGETVLRFRGAPRGAIMFRGISYHNYNGTSWTMLPDKALDDLYDNGKVFYTNDTEQQLVSPLTMPSLTTKNSFNFNYQLSVTSPVSMGFLFTPYYFYDNKAAYSGAFEAYLPISSSNQVTTDDFIYYLIDYNKSNDLIPDIINENQYVTEYSLFANKYYTDVPENLKENLLGFLSDRGVFAGMNTRYYVESIKDIMTNFGDYTLFPPVIPEGIDYVSFFLNSSQKGYCMQYATASVLLFRSMGVPARYVSGFSAMVTNVNAWTNIPDSSAHAWVEVFVENIGWIPVDVTPADYFSSGNDESSSAESSEEIYESSEITEESISAPIEESSEESNKINESSSEASSKTESSSAASSAPDTSSQEIITEPFDFSGLKYLFIAVAALTPFISLYVRRYSIKSKRRKDFEAKNNNKAAIAAWVYMQKLLPYNKTPDDKFKKIAQKAFFSAHIISDNERNHAIQSALSASEQAYKNLNLFEKLVFKYVKALK